MFEHGDMGNVESSFEKTIALCALEYKHQAIIKLTMISAGKFAFNSYKLYHYNIYGYVYCTKCHITF